ncbi:MAG: ABC transporter ATP-binding protein [Lachnospiraceae bacterium]|nr:ABC transporter ATP-binding protein [Lachnospiraceae bacterium]
MLKIENIRKVFNPGTINEKVALDGVDLTLEEGEFVTVIGGNGAGKSTTLNAVAGVWPVDSGKIYIGGEDVTKLSEHRRAQYLGRVFQDPMTGTATTMSIEENMAIAARRGKSRGLRWGITKAEREKYREMLSTLHLGLEDRLTSKVGLLSGGQRQAITLLMASIQKPKLLLLDEHTAALDPKTAAKVLEISDQIISENHLTAMMVTHNMKDAIAHGNRLIMMHEGKVILNIAGEDKKKLTVGDLLHQFEKVSGEQFARHNALISKKITQLFRQDKGQKQF